MWYVYVVECRDKTLYTGITNDVAGRITDHNGSERGAKYTRSRRPVKLVYKRGFREKGRAMKEEYKVKRLSREEKMLLISN